MIKLREKLIKLGYKSPDLRKHLRPILDRIKNAGLSDYIFDFIHDLAELPPDQVVKKISKALNSDNLDIQIEGFYGWDAVMNSDSERYKKAVERLTSEVRRKASDLYAEFQEAQDVFMPKERRVHQLQDRSSYLKKLKIFAQGKTTDFPMYEFEPKSEKAWRVTTVSAKKTGIEDVAVRYVVENALTGETKQNSFVMRGPVDKNAPPSYRRNNMSANNFTIKRTEKISEDVFRLIADATFAGEFEETIYSDIRVNPLTGELKNDPYWLLG